MHLFFFEKHVRSIPTGGRIAIMGSTPEFCDLATRLGVQNIDIIDLSEDFYRRSLDMRMFQQNDNYICADWRTYFKDHPNCYDLILSDLTLGNIAYSDRRDLYLDIRKSLSNSGLFVTKVLTNETGLRSTSDLICLYEDKPFNLITINQFSCHFYFTSELIADGILDTNKICTFLASPSQPEYIRKLNKYAIELTPIGHVWHYGRPWELDDREMRVAFDIVESMVDHENHAYSGRLRLIAATRK